MINKDKITSNHYRYFAAGIVVCLIFIVLINHEAVTEIAESQANIIMGRDVPDECGSSSFWAKYDLWGDTSTIYKPAAESDNASKPADNQNCPSQP